jgi:hypothetical protein
MVKIYYITQSLTFYGRKITRLPLFENGDFLHILKSVLATRFGKPLSRILRYVL